MAKISIKKENEKLILKSGQTTLIISATNGGATNVFHIKKVDLEMVDDTIKLTPVSSNKVSLT